jgi:hypothetical protein
MLGPFGGWKDLEISFIFDGFDGSTYFISIEIYDPET